MTTNENRGVGVVLLLLAVVIAVIGFVNAAAGPTCGSEAMSPGDTCYFDGEPSSYEDRRQAARLGPFINSAIAIVLVGFAIGSWRRGRRGGRASTPPLARTTAEAHLAMGLHPCACGGTGFTHVSSSSASGSGPVRRFSGTCRSCGTPREFLFRVQDEQAANHPGGIRFGDGTASQLIDPGMWLALADHYARLVPGNTSALDDGARAAARTNIASAAAAMDEVIAFIPRGESSVPAQAFSSPLGRQVRDREPGRFGRRRLEVVRDTYRQILAELE